MQTLEQKVEHKKRAVLQGYRKAIKDRNVPALQNLIARYPQFDSDFQAIDRRLYEHEGGKK